MIAPITKMTRIISGRSIDQINDPKEENNKKYRRKSRVMGINLPTKNDITTKKEVCATTEKTSMKEK
jgi:hypothetical protein